MLHMLEQIITENITFTHSIQFPPPPHFPCDVQKSALGTVRTRQSPSIEPDTAALTGFRRSQSKNSGLVSIHWT